ncbi:hypothetical protein N658DRAFT_167343 [Parathielavia hyrcaniae]|uniref:Uncharacterized protein n=1 Tax=Parathielavia hyrcaniae TaxID=113614 RepID=A0AAN6PWM4_9PEZI|nr:hypothetical protein N658DRAFT_167343 [Parathielavia hyrcaniae]
MKTRFASGICQQPVPSLDKQLPPPLPPIIARSFTTRSAPPRRLLCPNDIPAGHRSLCARPPRPATTTDPSKPPTLPSFFFFFFGRSRALLRARRNLGILLASILGQHPRLAPRNKADWTSGLPFAVHSFSRRLIFGESTLHKTSG